MPASSGVGVRARRRSCKGGRQSHKKQASCMPCAFSTSAGASRQANPVLGRWHDRTFASADYTCALGRNGSVPSHAYHCANQLTRLCSTKFLGLHRKNNTTTVKDPAHWQIGIALQPMSRRGRLGLVEGCYPCFQCSFACQ